MKRVKIVNTITGTPVLVDTNATTFGQLKRELAEKSQFRDVDWKNTTSIQRDSTGRATKSLDDETISNEESFTLFISPSKHKGGVYSPSILRDLKSKINTVFDELIEAAGSTVGFVSDSTSSKPSFTPGIIQALNYDALVEVIDTYSLYVDASDYDEYSDSDMGMLRAEVIDALNLESTSAKEVVYSKPSSGLSAEEEKDLADLRRG